MEKELKRTRHLWCAEDDGLLLLAYEKNERAEGKILTKIFWGRVQKSFLELGGPTVSPGACHRRFNRILQNPRDLQTQAAGDNTSAFPVPRPELKDRTGRAEVAIEVLFGLIATTMESAGKREQKLTLALLQLQIQQLRNTWDFYMRS